MYKLFLSFRYLLKRRIAFFAITAVTLCTAMVLIVISVMGGFLDMVKERSRGLLADLIVDNYSLQGFPYYQEFIDELGTQMPDAVAAATPVVYNYGTIRFPDDITKPVYIVGVRLQEVYQVNDFYESLYYEQVYPGSTSLAPQQQPVFGFDEKLMAILPPDLEEQLRRAAAEDPAHAATYYPQRESGMRFPGPGAYDSPAFVGVFLLERLRDDVLDLASAVRREEDEPADGFFSMPMPHRFKGLREDRRTILDRLEPLSLSAEVLDPLHQLESLLNAAETALQEEQQERAGELLDLAFEGLLYQISILRRHLEPGYIGPELPGVIIGRDMVGKPLEGSDYERYYYRGERVVVTFLPFSRKGAIAPTGAISKAMRYIDDSRYGVYDIDKQNIYIDFDRAQTWLGMHAQRLADELGGGMTPPRASQVQIKLRPGADLLESRERVREILYALTDRIANERPPGTTDDDIRLMRAGDVETWQERQRQFIAAVEKEKVLVTTLFAVISVVAVLLVGCIFYMIVQQKTRDIGIIKSIGATSAGIASIFISYGLLVGIVGALLGLVFGAVFVHYINEIQELLAALNPSLRVWSRETYMFDTIPNTVKTQEAAVIVIVAIISSVLGSLVPAWRAARVWPVECLRDE